MKKFFSVMAVVLPLFVLGMCSPPAYAQECVTAENIAEGMKENYGDKVSFGFYSGEDLKVLHKYASTHTNIIYMMATNRVPIQEIVFAVYYDHADFGAGRIAYFNNAQCLIFSVGIPDGFKHGVDKAIKEGADAPASRS